MEKNKIRVGIASGDGKFVTRHFGHTDRFYIADVTEDGFEGIGLRMCTPVCNMGEHNENDAENAIDVLSDCDCVLVAKIGLGMQEFLKSHGIRFYEIADMIPVSLREVFRRESKIQ